MSNEKDNAYLRIISISYYFLGGITMLFSLLPLVHISLGIMSLCGKMETTSSPPPAFLGVLLIVIGATAMLLIAAIGICLIYTGRCINNRRHFIFCMVMSGLSCSSFPLGTALGIFTIILLVKPEIKAEFESNAAPPLQP